jgi:hypothetical protein
LLETGIQRKLYAKSLAYCRCVEGMLGEKIWDLLDLAQEIDYAVTSNKGTDWDGRFETIPDMLRAHMGREVYRALNDLDPDALTSLMQAVDEALSKRSIAPEEPDPFLTP